MTWIRRGDPQVGARSAVDRELVTELKHGGARVADYALDRALDRDLVRHLDEYLGRKRGTADADS